MAGNGTYLTVLDLVVVHVLGSGGVLADILILGQLIDEDFAAIPAVGLGEAVLRGGLLDGERQLAEGGVRLLAVKRLGQGGQVYINARTKNELTDIIDGEMVSKLLPRRLYRASFGASGKESTI